MSRTRSSSPHLDYHDGRSQRTRPDRYEVPHRQYSGQASQGGRYNDRSCGRQADNQTTEQDIDFIQKLKRRIENQDDTIRNLKTKMRGMTEEIEDLKEKNSILERRNEDTVKELDRKNEMITLVKACRKHNESMKRHVADMNAFMKAHACALAGYLHDDVRTSGNSKTTDDRSSDERSDGNSEDDDDNSVETRSSKRRRQSRSP